MKNSAQRIDVRVHCFFYISLFSFVFRCFLFVGILTRLISSFYCFQCLPQLMQVMKMVIGSSALLVCIW